jgi:hypothetical protein
MQQIIARIALPFSPGKTARMDKPQAKRTQSDVNPHANYMQNAYKLHAIRIQNACKPPAFCMHSAINFPDFDLVFNLRTESRQPLSPQKPLVLC